MKAKAMIVSVEMTQKDLHDLIEDYLRTFEANTGEKLRSDLYGDINEYLKAWLYSLKSDGLVDVVDTIYEGK